MKKNNLIFYLITFVILLKIISTTKGLTKSEPWHSIPDIPIFIISAATFVVVWITYKNKLIRYSISFLFISYFFESLARMMHGGSKGQLIANVLALVLLPLSFIYALKYKVGTNEDITSKSEIPYQPLFVIIVAIILMIAIFILYGQPSIR